MKHNASNRTERRIDKQGIHILLVSDVDRYLPEQRKHLAEHRNKKQFMVLRKQIWEKGE